jgi:flagellar protein FliT
MSFAPSQIGIYEQMCELSASMVDAARANDWDRLVDVERQVAALRGQLIALHGKNTEAGEDSMGAADIQRKQVLIQQMLAHDAEVRRHVEPWMAHVRQLLGDQHRRRQMLHAYAASNGAANAGV